MEEHIAFLRREIHLPEAGTDSLYYKKGTIRMDCAPAHENMCLFDASGYDAEKGIA